MKGMAYLLLLIFCVNLDAQSFIVDHTCVDANDNIIPQQYLDLARNNAHFFNHRSIGGQMLDGINSLASQNSGRYSINVAYNNGTSAGIHHRQDGSNQDPAAKITGFRNNIANGHNTAFMKFCVGDFPPWTSYDPGTQIWPWYRDGMIGEQAEHPGVIVVWFTSPLTTAADGRGRASFAEYNNLVRQYAAQHEIVLFDIADIESHDPAGNPITSSDGYEAMYDGYDTDGAHLNATGQQRLARALWWLFARCAGWNPGGGNPPGSPSNLSTTATSPATVDLTWTDNSNNETGFHVERSSNGTTGWTQIASVDTNTTTYTDSGLTASTTYYYRVRAYNDAGNSEYSNINSATTPDIPCFISPDSVGAEAGSPFGYKVRYENTLGDDATIEFIARPSWIPESQIIVDSVFGTPTTQGIDTIRVLLIVGETTYDTLTVRVFVTAVSLVRARARGIPVSFGLSAIAMSAKGVSFQVSLDKIGNFRLEVYDVTGRKVWEYDGADIKAAGSYRLHWLPSKGSILASNGLYIARISQENRHVMCKFAIVQ